MKNLFKPKRIGAGYLLRWHLIPRNRFFNIYLHKFIGNDDERACHDHPWSSFSIRLRGRLIEHYDAPEFAAWLAKHYRDVQLNTFTTARRFAPRFCYRPAEFAHRLELVGGKPAWTLFITGPVKREWGFLCASGWKHWRTMTTPDGKAIGGCDD